MIHVEVVETSSLGDRSYLAHDGRLALVIDPQRDIDRVLALAGRLGVRMGNEWRAGHLDDATHIPLPDLPNRLTEVPDGTVWVHCGSGYRAAAATGLLIRAGRRVVHIDDAYADAAAAGLTITAPETDRRTTEGRRP
ncbi:rhodanese-related sulfurtransferase [Streptosporangium album]|uniref:Rhodanese-related sulfurtransferase n=1 Tax=Streptosporangium album TaxID=47479 RepID=A0A7W7RPJ7_9ACTN|nr:rhodanese-like domain-containing protein [Streptosporangium album]MBB4935837.1 rhodanese-related sulfurtransferase [Streptosporangium album]